MKPLLESLALVFFLISHFAHAGSLFVSNSKGFDSNPIVDPNGSLLTVSDSVMVVIGTFSSAPETAVPGSEENVDGAIYTNMLAEFTPYGNPANLAQTTAPLNLRGVFSFQGNTKVAGTPLEGKPVYAVIARGATLATATQVAILKSDALFLPDDDLSPFPKLVGLGNTLGTVTIIGSANRFNASATPLDPESDASYSLATVNRTGSGMLPPTVTTGTASGVNATSATLRGIVNPSGTLTTARFDYGLTTDYSNSTVVSLSPADGSDTQTVSATIGGLQLGQTYHFRIAATNEGGTSLGEDITFLTYQPVPFIVLEQSPGVEIIRGSVQNYGSTLVGTTTSRTFTIRNTGTGSLTGVALSINGSNASHYSVLTSPATQVLPGESTSFVLAFSPGSNGPKNATLRITSNLVYDADPFEINLSGLGSSTLSAAYTTGTEVPVSAPGFTAASKTANLSLNFAPPTGANLLVVNNMGTGFINGMFSNLEHGDLIGLAFGGITYNFVVNYFGGNGNDLVLQWAGTRLLAWGANSSGTLGNSTTTGSNVPVPVDMTGVLDGKTITAMACGENHSIVLCSDGRVAAWGANGSGQIGDNTTVRQLLPVLVDATTDSALFGKTVVAIAAGYDFSVALCSDGSVAAWGLNGAGQLGDGTTARRLRPVLVNATGGSALAGKVVVSIAAGYDYCLALCADGTVAAWGNNSYGQIGNGSQEGCHIPVTVDTTGVLYGRSVSAIAAGHFHSMALCADGTIAAWGDNTYGELGNNSGDSSLVPVLVGHGGALAAKVPARLGVGQLHGMVLCQDGTLATWGDNTSGQLGLAGIDLSRVPVVVDGSGVLRDKLATFIAAGQNHNIALLADGTLAAWGENSLGQLGAGNIGNSVLPVAPNTSALGAGERIVGIASGPTASHGFSLDAVPLASLSGPFVTTKAASSVTKTTAVIHGLVNPNDLPTDVCFEYGLTTNYDRVTRLVSIGSGRTVKFCEDSLADLAPNTTYHYRIRAINTGGTVLGDDMVFTTVEDPPSASSATPTRVTVDTADLSGALNPNGHDTHYYFELGSTILYGDRSLVKLAPKGSDVIQVNIQVGGLEPNATYHCRLVASSSGGTAYGSDIVFTTRLPDPKATTGGSSFDTTTSVLVNGTVRAGAGSVQVFFDYGTDPGNLSLSMGATPFTVAGDVDTAVSAVLPNLNQGTTYYYRVRAERVGGIGTGKGNNASFDVAILSGLSRKVPSAPPPACGRLTVTLTPSGVGGWRFAGEQQWRESGVPVDGLTTSDRVIECMPVNDFVQPPPEPVSVISGGDPTDIILNYETSSQSGSGGITVALKPDTIANPQIVPEATRAQWRLFKPGENYDRWLNSGETLDGLNPGTYLVECKRLEGRITPPPSIVLVDDGLVSGATLIYLLKDPQTGVQPAVLPFETVLNSASLPYQFVGQIRSDVGSSSGFVVKPRVVATAGHVVFDDGALSMVTGLQWLFQRDSSTHEPKPQIPRGAVLLDGYAASRTGAISGEGSAQSQSCDVAALFFLENAGRGGFSGFLASDAVENEFLKSQSSKLLVGYPVDSLAGFIPGRMHATMPMDAGFDRIPAVDQSGVPYRTYVTEDIRGSGGMSGGPLCVQFEGGAYYPAAVYLGGSGQTVVRAIDSRVIQIFNDAELSAVSGDNDTGGGITFSSFTTVGDPSDPGALKVTIRPAAARTAGALWRLKNLTGDQPSGNQVSGLDPSSETVQYILQLSTVAGFQAPAERVVVIRGGNLREIVFTYDKIILAPVITSANAIAGTRGQILNYRILASPVAESYSLSGSLPAGLTFSSTTGLISGTLAQAGVFTVTVSAANSGGHDTMALTIISRPSMANQSATVPLGQPIDFQIASSESGTGVAFGATGLPLGVSLDPSSGRLSGSPLQAGVFASAVTISKGGASTTATITITVTATPLDIWRLANLGTTNNIGDAADKADPDGDGSRNLDEYAAGTNPNNAADVFKVLNTTRGATTFTVTAPGKVSRAYALERRISLVSGTWTTVDSAGSLAADGPVSLTDTAPPGGSGFYRVRVSAP